MTFSTDRRSLAAIIAGLGALLGLVALLLPWLSFDQAGMAQFMREFGSRSGVDTSGFTSEQFDMSASMGIGMVERLLGDELKGFKVLSTGGVVLRVVLTVGAFAAAARLASGESGPKQAGTSLLISGGLLAVRPGISLFSDPGDPGDLGTATGYPLLRGVEAHLFNPGSGVYVALFGAALVLAAGILAQLEADEGTAPAAESAVAATGPSPMTPYGAPAQAATAMPQCDVAPPQPPGHAAPLWAQPAPAAPAPTTDRSGSVAPPGFS